MVSILGLVSLYEVLILQRATLAYVGCALKFMGLHSSRQHSMDPWGCSEMLEILLLDEEDALGSPFPTQPHRCTMHLEVGPKLVGWCGIPYTTIRALACNLQESSTHLETHEVIIVPPHPLGAPHVYCLENKGPTPCPSLLRVLLFIMVPMDLIRPLGGTYDMYYSSSDLLRGLFFHLWASLVGLSPKDKLLARYFIFGAYLDQGD